MTNEQKDSLNEVKARNSYLSYNGTVNGTYLTKDIEVLLSLLQEQESILLAVKEDLESLKDYLIENSTSMAVSMVSSTLLLLGEE